MSRIGFSERAVEPAKAGEALKHQVLGSLPPLTGIQMQELDSLLREINPEMFHQGLLQLGARLEQDENLEAAAAVYSALRTEPSVQAQAKQRLDAITGVGAFGARADFLLRRLTRETLEPATLLGMGAASAAFKATRLAALSRLLANPAATRLTRGWGARTAAGLIGFGVEATVFPLATRLGNAALGRDLEWSAEQIRIEMASSFIVLGAMKMTGRAISSAALYSTGGARSAANYWRMPLRHATSQAGMLAGILLGHRVEEAVGLKPHLDDATTTVDSLAMLLQFNVAGKLTRDAFGKKFHQWERELEMHTAVGAVREPPPSTDGVYETIGLPLQRPGAPPPSIPPLHPRIYFSSGGQSPPPGAALDFLNPIQGRSWGEYLSRQLAVTREDLNAARLPVRGSTIFHWGSSREGSERSDSPGNILHLLGVVTYLNTQRGVRGVDPFEAIRMTLPEQLGGFQPDGMRNIPVRYPALLAEVSYQDLNLTTLLRFYLASIPEAQAMDLAREWGVSSSTVEEYQSTSRKMRLDNLQALAQTLLPAIATPEEQGEMYKFLIFLRHRPYFEATMDVMHRDHNHAKPQLPRLSDYAIHLIPQGEDLRSLDLTRRIHFEAEPFAAVLNGTASLALDLWETRLKEFKLTETSPLSDPRGWSLEVEQLVADHAQRRERHREYSDLIYRQSQNPQIVQPSAIREMQDFYRDFFREFEIHDLHVRPAGEWKNGNTSIEYQIVLPTKEQPRGVRVTVDPENPHRVIVYAVAADLFENGKDLGEGALQEMFRLRVACAYLREAGLLLPGGIGREENRRVIRDFFRSQALVKPSDPSLDRFAALERASQFWWPSFLDRAVVHRIGRGRGFSAGGQEEKILEPGPEPPPAKAGESAPGLSLESFAEAAFAGYLDWFTARDFVRLHDRHLVEDPALMAAVIAERLRYHHRFVEQKEEVTQQMRRLIAEYNARPDAIRVRILADDPRAQEEPFRSRLGSWDPSVLFPFFKEAPGVDPAEWTRLYFAGLAILRGQMVTGLRSKRGEPFLGIGKPRLPVRGQISLALEVARQRMEAIDGGSPQLNTLLLVDYLESGCREIQQELEAFSRLAPLVHGFIQSRRYHSGVENNALLAAELERIFRLHTASVLVDLESMKLHEAISMVLGERFLPYEKIRGEVIGDLRLVYREALDHLVEHYRELEQDFNDALAEAKQHRDVSRLWEDFGVLASVHHPKLADPGRLRERIADLENFLDLLVDRPPLDLSGRLQAEIEGLERRKANVQVKAVIAPEQLRAVLDATTAEEIYARFPELHWAAADRLAEPIQRIVEAGGVALLAPEARPLFQLLAVLERFGKTSPPEVRERLETLELEILTAPPGKALQETIRTALDAYAALRPTFLPTVPASELVAALPEVQEVARNFGGSIVGETRLGEARTLYSLMMILSLYKLSPEVKKEFLAVTDRSAKLPDLQVSNAPTLFLPALASLYWKHRQEIFAAPYLEVSAQDMKDLGRDTIPEPQRKKIDRELPELNLIDAARLEEIINDTERQAKTHGVPSHNPASGYLALKLMGLLVDSGVLEAGRFARFSEEILQHYQRMGFLVAWGASPAHVGAAFVDPILETYLKYRPAILNFLSEKWGVEKLLEVLPELKSSAFEPEGIGLEDFQIPVPFFADLRDAGKMADRLRRSLPPDGLKKFEAALWNFEAPEEMALLQMEAELRPLVHQMLQELLLQRNRRHPLAEVRQPASRALVEERLKAETKLYWELRAVSREQVSLVRDQMDKKLRTLMEARDEVQLRFRFPEKEGYRILDLYGNKGQLPDLRLAIESKDPAKLPNGVTLPTGAELQVIPLAYLGDIGELVITRAPLPLAQMVPMVVVNAGDKPNELLKAVKTEVHRATALILLGLDPAWVYEMLGRRLINRYQRHREAILQKQDFITAVWEFPEIAEIAEEEIESLERKFPQLNPLNKHDYPLYSRVRLIVFLAGHHPGNEHLLRAWNQRASKVKKGGSESFAARFYLEHREEVLSNYSSSVAK